MATGHSIVRIDRIDLFHVAMPLVYPWRTAYGEDSQVESVLVRLASGNDEAWGETTPLAAPCYSPEYAAGVFGLLRDWLAPHIVGTDIAAGETLLHMLEPFKGNSFAKAGLEVAWWCLKSVQCGIPLHRLLGADRDEALVGADFGVMDSLDELTCAVGQAVDQGFARIKLKFRPGWDIAMVEAVRKQHPTHPVHIDCNSGYTLRDLEMFRKLDRFELTMIEQPLGHDDLLDHAHLQKAIETPLCLDESITSFDRARQAIELGSCRFINIKPGRVGGLAIARKIHDACRDAGIPCWVGGMLESSVGAHAMIALAMLDNFSYPADIFPSSRFYAADLGEPAIELTRTAQHHPAVRAADIAGNPSRPNPQRLAEWMIASASIGC